MTGQPGKFDLDSLRAELGRLPGTTPVGLRSVLIGGDALPRLGEVIDQQLPAGSAASAVVLVDEVRKRYRGGDLTTAVTRLLASGHPSRVVVVGIGGGRVHADPATLAKAVADVGSTAVLVSVGSGTLVDIGKAVAHQLGDVVHVVVQTALSVNGFADNQSVLLIDGVKRTTPTQWPTALIADNDVLAEAPADLNSSGVGDLVSMFTAPADWRLANVLGMGEGYRDRLAQMVRDTGTELIDAASRLPERDPAAIEVIARVLTLSGISMGAAGTTAPSSGAEHTISHLVEMAASQRGIDGPFHGAQVGVCTVANAEIWCRLRAMLATGAARVRFPSAEHIEPLVHAAFARIDPSGGVGAECWRLYAKKLARWHEHRAELEALDLAGTVEKFTDLLAEPSTVRQVLQRSGGATTFAALHPAVDDETARWAIANCHLMRDRFSVVDLMFFLGAWDDAVAADVFAATQDRSMA